MDRDQPSGGCALGRVFEDVAEGLMLFDADDRLLVCNAAASDFFAPIGKAMVPGAKFGDLARQMAGSAVDLDGGTADDWVAARLERHRNPDGAFEERLADGRWIRVSEGPAGNGGTVAFYTDVTVAKERERKLLEGGRHYQDLNEIGIALSSEKNVNRLLEMILLEAKHIANADGGTVYLYTSEEAGDWKSDGRIDRRCGGDRRSGYDRRTHLDVGQTPGGPAADGPPPKRSDRRAGVDRRRRPDILEFAIMHNDSLDIAMGGTTGKEIPFPPLRIYDAATGQGNYQNVATVVALTGEGVNIPDAYTAEEFDFSGTKAFDANSGYRSTSFLTIPMKNKKDEVIGVLQLINSRDRATGEPIAFDPDEQKVIESLASQAAVALDNQMLIEGQRKLLASFIQLIASAIDEKSPYTGGHCERVPVLTEMLAEAACDATEGPFKGLPPQRRGEVRASHRRVDARLRQGDDAGIRGRQVDQARDHLRPGRDRHHPFRDHQARRRDRLPQGPHQEGGRQEEAQGRIPRRDRAPRGRLRVHHGGETSAASSWTTTRRTACAASPR